MKKLIFIMVLMMGLIPCSVHSGNWPRHSYGTDGIPRLTHELLKSSAERKARKKERQEEMERQLLFEKRISGRETGKITEREKYLFGDRVAQELWEISQIKKRKLEK